MENFMKRYKDPLFAGLDDLFRTPPPDSPIQNTYQTASDPPPPPPPHPKEATLTKSPISIISISAESSNQENPKMSSPILDYQEDDSLYKLIIVTMEDIVRLQEELIDSNSTRHQECIDRIKSRLEEMNKVIEAINKTKEERKNNLKSYIDNCIKIALQEFISSSNLDQDNKNAKQKGKSEGSERGSSKSSSSTRSNENLKSNRGLRELKSLGQDFFSAERAKDKEDAKSISTNSKQREEYENPSLKLANRGTTNDLPGNRHNTNSTNNSAFISTGASNGPHTMTVSKASTQRKPGLKSSDIIDLTFSSDEEEDSLNSISSNSPKSKANLSIYSPAVKSDTKDRSSGNLEAGPSQRPLNPPMKVTPCSLKNLEERPIYAGKERNLKRSHTTFIQSERNPQSSQSSQIFNYKRWSETAKSKISGTIIGKKQILNSMQQRKVFMYLVRKNNEPVESAIWVNKEEIQDFDDKLLDLQQDCDMQNIDFRKNIVILPQAHKYWDINGNRRITLDSYEQATKRNQAIIGQRSNTVKTKFTRLY